MSAPALSKNVDLEAQMSSPPAVLTYISRAPPTAHTISPLDDFFGYTLSSSRTHESRHDQSVTEPLPPYVDDLPAYTRTAPEPATLAKYLFKFGFLFPPFWIMGAFILLSPLKISPVGPDGEAWLPEKTESEREQILANMRKVEVRWAKRCLWALLVFLVLAVGAGIAAWAVISHS